MRPIIYDVAVTLDGYICHEDGSADGFVGEGEHVADYLQRLQQYDTVLMGRKTYEFGYAFGLVPGERAYPHMEHFVFSSSLRFDNPQVQVVSPDRLDLVEQLKQSSGGPIYLCGGGQFAAALLDHQLIDQFVVKLNPVLFGSGIQAFGNHPSTQARFDLRESKPYSNGVCLLKYDVIYNGSGVQDHVT